MYYKSVEIVMWITIINYVYYRNKLSVPLALLGSMTLSFDDLYKCQLASLMWDYDHGNLPDNLNSLFTSCESIHSVNLRNSANHRLYTSFKWNTKYGTKSFSQVGSQLLNELKDLNFYDTMGNKKAFMKKYKQTFLDIY